MQHNLVTSNRVFLNTDSDRGILGRIFFLERTFFSEEQLWRTNTSRTFHGQIKASVPSQTSAHCSLPSFNYKVSDTGKGGQPPQLCAVFYSQVGRSFLFGVPSRMSVMVTVQTTMRSWGCLGIVLTRAENIQSCPRLWFPNPFVLAQRADSWLLVVQSRQIVW